MKELNTLYIFSAFLHSNSKAYSKPSQTSTIEHFTKILNILYPLIIFAKSSILDT